MSGRSQSFCNRPAVIVYPHLDSLAIDARDVRPINYMMGCTIECYEACVRAITHLFRWCCPPTIARFVVAIVVYPIKRVFIRWSLTHIFEEIDKTISAKPFITYFDPSTAIPIIKSNIRIKASTFHLMISPKLFSPITLATLSVFILGVSPTAFMWHNIDIITQTRG